MELLNHVGYIDGCKVRDKMLYSSSREDLKRNLGLGQFVPDYPANVVSDLSWNAYILSTTKSVEDQVMTDKEKQLRVDDLATDLERAALGTKSTAMGVIPFTLGPGVLDAFKQFQTGKHNWIELSVVSEVVKLESAKSLQITDNLASHVNTQSARFLLIKFTNFEKKLLPFFVYSCPENIPIREKMTMSTSKATVIGAAAQNGITFER